MWFFNKLLKLKIETFSANEYKGLRSIANQMLVTVDYSNRLLANFSYKHPNELTEKEMFHISEKQDRTEAIVLKSTNGLYVCLVNNELLATCNASTEDEQRLLFCFMP